MGLDIPWISFLFCKTEAKVDVTVFTTHAHNYQEFSSFQI